MKQILLSIMILALISLQNHAQNISGSHAYRIGDKITKQVVEYAPDEVSFANMVWDLRELSEQDGKHMVSYIDVFGKDNLLAGVEDNTLHYYEHRNDSLLKWGYENNLTKVEYDSPILMLKTPLVYGSRQVGLFHGRTSYCERVFSRVFGEYMVEVDGTGILLLPGGDTLRYVSRVHLREVTVSRPCPQLSTYKTLKAYTDSLPFTNDSIRAGLLSDSLRTVTDTYRWYALGYRYPILETVRTEIQGCKPVTAAYYCPPEEQQTLYDDENEKVRKQLADLDRQNANAGNNGDGNGQGDTQPSALSRCDVSVSGQTITIDYDLSEGATVEGLVCNVSGMVFRQQSQTHAPGEHYRMQLDCTGLRRGEYVLYLNVNGQVTGTTVSL